MADFRIIIPANKVARQIASLLNVQNRLRKKHTAQSILASLATYFIETEGDRVIGCSALMAHNVQLSKSFHTSVVSDRMGQGLGSKLLSAAINNCRTPLIFGIIREDNEASLAMVSKLGFKHLARTYVKDHYIITVGRNTNHG